ncbi:MAG: hypothetical protein GY845_16655 [Planctomycetes bacterium]|nr:hypothetical protein [Planctomycetota bacterium]
MEQSKFDEAVQQLTETISDNKSAADALQLLVADYYLTKTRVVNLNKTITALGQEGQLAEVLEKTEERRISTLEELEGLSVETKEILQNLGEAQQDMQVANEKMQEVVEEYDKLSGNIDQLGQNVKTVLAGAIKSFLGPAAEFGPVKNIADKLFS